MIIGFLITVVVLAISLWLVSLLPTGVEIDSPVKALLGGAIIGFFLWHHQFFYLKGYGPSGPLSAWASSRSLSASSSLVWPLG